MSDVEIFGIVMAAFGFIVMFFVMVFDFLSIANSDSKISSFLRRSYMTGNKLHFEIRSRSKNFYNRFRLRSYTDDYLCFEYISRTEYWNISIIKTSVHSYRVLTFYSLHSLQKFAEYRSFRSIYDLCLYLDSICPSAVENK